jgi:hypothetical protein
MQRIVWRWLALNQRQNYGPVSDDAMTGRRDLQVLTGQSQAERAYRVEQPPSRVSRM